MGVIETVSAGIGVVARNPWLLLLPVLADLFFWLAPPLRLAPGLVEMLVAPFEPAGAATLPGTLGNDVGAVYEALNGLLGETNLWTFLLLPFLFWPTLAGRPSPSPTVGAEGALQVGQIGSVLGILVALALFGLWLNVFWLHIVADSRREGETLSWASLPVRARQSVRHALRWLLLFMGLIALLVGLLVPLSIGVAVVTLVVPAIGQGLASLLTLGTSWGALWVGLHLYFSIAAIVLDDVPVLQAARQSLAVVRRHFWGALGFIGLGMLLSAGFQGIWGWLSAVSAAGHGTSIVANAALGTTIAAAMFLFYEQRRALPEPLPTQDE